MAKPNPARRRARRALLASPTAPPPPGAAVEIAVFPDAAAVAHLAKTWTPPLPASEGPYLWASQAVTLAVAHELGQRYLATTTYGFIEANCRVLLRLAAENVRLRGVPLPPAVSTLEDYLRRHDAGFQQAIASWRAAFAQWADDVGTTAALLWQAWAPGVIHPAVAAPPNAADVPIIVAGLHDLWRRQLSLLRSPART